MHIVKVGVVNGFPVRTRRWEGRRETEFEPSWNEPWRVSRLRHARNYPHSDRIDEEAISDQLLGRLMTGKHAQLPADNYWNYRKGVSYILYLPKSMGLYHDS